MKRTPMPPRRTRLPRSTTPLPAVNPRQQAARGKRSRGKAAKARTSEGYRLAFLRAGGRCEATDAMPWGFERCPETEGLQGHHRGYMRYGGDELAEDFDILCARHHAWVEGTTYSYRRHGR